MSGEHMCRCGVSGALRVAIERGWRGLALGCVPPRGPVTAVCAAPADRIDELAARGLAVGLAPQRACGHPAHRRVTIAPAGDQEMALNPDLAFADARALAARLGRDGCLRLVWARAEDAATARIDLVVLGPAISDRLRVDAAHHGEWRVADPHPDGFSRLRWWRESMRSGRPRLARGDLAGRPWWSSRPPRTGGRPRTHRTGPTSSWPSPRGRPCPTRRPASASASTTTSSAASRRRSPVRSGSSS